MPQIQRTSRAFGEHLLRSCVLFLLTRWTVDLVVIVPHVAAVHVTLSGFAAGKKELGAQPFILSDCCVVQAGSAWPVTSD